MTKVNIGVTGFLVALLVSAAGCNHAKSTYYFATADLGESSEGDRAPRLNFYKMEVEGESFNTKSSYAAGFYDKKALRSLYGEVASANGDLDRSADHPDPTSQDGSGSIQFTVNQATGQLSLTRQDSLFTIFYGANASELASQVSSFADNDATGEKIGALLVGLAGGATLDAANEANKKLDDLNGQSKPVTAALEAAKAAVASTQPTRLDVRRSLLATVRAASKALGGTQSYADPTVLQDNEKFKDEMDKATAELAKLRK